jgi:hypothetical protein
MPANTTKRERVQADRVGDLYLRDADITAGAEAGNVIGVVIQLHDRFGRALQEVGAVDVWLSDTSKGGVTAAAPSGGWAAHAGGTVKLVDITANKLGIWLSQAADGQVLIDVTEVGVKSFYVCARKHGDNRIAVKQITFA